eukprot:SAG31_NODE_956_length_10790_cov_34.583107_3_plen_342_part_00
MSVVQYFGYDDAVALENGACRVVLTGHGGGRVLEYAWRGHNAVYLPDELPPGLEAPTDDASGQRGWKHRPGENDDGPAGGPAGGRMDIGPEMLNPARPALWLGSYTVEVTGPRSAIMTSLECPATGVQLVREFALDGGDSSHLKVTQTIRNVCDGTRQYFHWSRSFAEGGGQVIIPLSEGSRYPSKYVMYGQAADGGGAILTSPSDPNVRERDGFLEILGAPASPKLGIDSYAGWLAYITKADVAWVKRFPTFPDRVYGEIAGFPLCVFYYEDLLVELEPIGPRETILPGAAVSFTEDWFLLEHTYPVGDRAHVDLPALSAQVAAAEAAAAAVASSESSCL